MAGARNGIFMVWGVSASQWGRREAEMALDAVRGGGREGFGPFLPKPRLPPLSRPVRFKYYLGGGQH